MAGKQKRNGSPTRDELGKRELHSGAGKAVENTEGLEQERRAPVAPMGDGGSQLQGMECVRRAAHLGCPESTAQLRSKGCRMAGTRMCDGLPTGAGLGSRIVPGRDGGRRHAQMCSADGVEGAPGRHGTIEMEP